MRDLFEKKNYEEGEPCEHKGCLGHVSHPCENCGRFGSFTIDIHPLWRGYYKRQLADKDTRIAELEDRVESIRFYAIRELQKIKSMTVDADCVYINIEAIGVNANNAIVDLDCDNVSDLEAENRKLREGMAEWIRENCPVCDNGRMPDDHGGSYECQYCAELMTALKDTQCT